MMIKNQYLSAPNYLLAEVMFSRTDKTEKEYNLK